MYFLTTETTETVKTILADTTATQQEKLVAVGQTLQSMTFNDIVALLVEWGLEIAAKIAIALAIYFIGRWLIGRLIKVVNKICGKRGVEISLQRFFNNMIKFDKQFIHCILSSGPDHDFMIIFCQHHCKGCAPAAGTNDCYFFHLR